MNQNKNVNSFAEEVKEDHTQPKNNSNRNNSNNTSVVDPDSKNRLRKKIIN
jgi:hypothetical protein